MILKKLSYMFFVLTLGVIASCGSDNTPSSNDATLKETTSMVKGIVLGLEGLGTPSATLAGATLANAGFVTLPATNAANVTNATGFITLFDPANQYATVKKVVRLTAAEIAEDIIVNGGNFINDDQFNAHPAYNNEALENDDDIVVKVKAQDDMTTLFYGIRITIE